MSIVKISGLNKKSDLIGMVSSLLCLFHCLALPLLVSARAFSAGQNELVEFGFLTVCLLAAWWSAKGASVWFRSAFWVLIWALALGIVGEDELPWAAYLIYGASAGLVLTHGLNFWQKRKD